MTINKIAKLAHVSKTTVSRVLNNKPDVSEETREAILKIINENNFKVNAMAKAISLKKSMSIGMIIPYDADFVFANSYYVEVMRGIYTQVDKRGYDLLICYPHNHNYQDMFIQKRVDGYILISPGSDHRYILQTLMDVKAPFVSTSKVIDWDQEIDIVDADNYKGGRELTKYLINLGHKNIAYIGKKSITSSMDRCRGYKDVLFENDIILQENWVRYVEKGLVDNAVETIRALMKECPDITAIISASDMLAIGVINGLKADGYKVPDDISVVGYDDIPLAKYYDPSITTMRQPAYEKGVKAVNLLIERLNDKENWKSKEMILDIELVVRNSTKKI